MVSTGLNVFWKYFPLYKIVAKMVKKEYNKSDSDYSEPICIFG